MTYQLRNVAVAVALGLLAAALTALYVTNYRKHVQSGQESAVVLVAKDDIPAGTSGKDIVSGHLLRKASVPRSALVPGAISSPAQIQRLVTVEKVNAGEQVSTRRFGNASELGVRAQLKGTLRAIQVAADPNQILAGTLRAGDHVDLVGNMKVDANGGGTSAHFDRVVLRNLLVLRAPSTDGQKGDIGGSQRQSVMLAVTDSQASKLLFVVKNADANGSPDGGWALELRPVTDAADGPENLETIDSVLLDGLGPAARAHALNGRLGGQQ